MMSNLKIAGVEAPQVAPTAGSEAPKHSEIDDAVGATLSIRPLVEYLKARDGAKYASVALTQAYYRARMSGTVTPDEADRLSISLAHVHPSVVWGEEWWSATSEEEIA